MGVALKANVPARIRLVGSNPTPAANMQPVLDGIEGTPYKRVHIVRLNEVVPICSGSSDGRATDLVE